METVAETVVKSMLKTVAETVGWGSCNEPATHLERKHSIFLIRQGRPALELGDLLASTDFGEARVLELARQVELLDQLAESLLGKARRGASTPA